MRVGVFRAAEDGRRTAGRLTALGHEAVLAPVLRIVPTGATVPAGTADGLVFTSAHAPEALAAHPSGIRHLTALPCWCVGGRTAMAAAAAGFTAIRTGAGDAASLSDAIAADRSLVRLTLVAGRDRKPDLEAGLARAALALNLVEAYCAEAVPQWPNETAARLRDIGAALHYSRRSAALAIRFADVAGLSVHFRAAAHLCLSEDIRLELNRHGLPKLVAAERPDEDSLLALLAATSERPAG